MLFHVFWFRSSICSVFIYTCVYEWSSDHNCFKCRLFYPIYLLLGLCVCFMYKFIVVINILKWKKKKIFLMNIMTHMQTKDNESSFHLVFRSFFFFSLSLFAFFSFLFLFLFFLFIFVCASFEIFYRTT